MIDNLKIIRDAFSLYAGDGKIWLLYVISLLGILFMKKKEAREIFLNSFLFFILTVFNPFLVGIFIKVFGLSNRYHRFLWMSVYFIVIAYCMVWLIVRFDKIWKKLISFCVCLILIVVLGEPCFYGQLYNFKMASNVYFTNDEILRLSDAFHIEGIEQPTVLYSEWLLNNYRMFDPSVKSFYTRKSFLTLSGMAEEEMLQNENLSKYYKALAAIYIFNDTDYIQPKTFVRIAQGYGIDYVVSKKGSLVSEFIRESDIPVLAETESMIVWKIPKEN